MSDETSSVIFEGDVNGISDRNEVVGWAVNASQPDQQVEIELIVDGAPHRTIANVPRQDLEARFPGNTHHGFVFPLLAPAGKTLSIEVRFAQNGQTVPRGTIDYTMRETAAIESTLRSDVNALGKDGKLVGWVFDSAQPTVVQDVNVRIGDAGWRFTASELREDVRKHHPSVGNCGFSWPLPADTPAGLQEIEVSHAATGQTLNRGSGIVFVPLRPENAVQDAEQIAWLNCTEGEVALAATVEGESFHSLSFIVAEAVAEDLDIKIRSVPETCRIVGSRRTVREGRSIPFETREQEDGTVLVSVRFCVRNSESFRQERFLEKRTPVDISLTVSAKATQPDVPWFANYLEIVRLTPPMLGFDVGQGGNQSPQAGAIAKLPLPKTARVMTADNNISQIVSLLLPSTEPDFASFVERFLGLDDVQAVARLVAILVHCEFFKRNMKDVKDEEGDIIAFDGWYDLNDSAVNAALEPFQRDATVIGFETQYEVSRLRVTSHDTWSLLFAGTLGFGPDFPKFVSDFRNIIVNFRDPAGGDTSALLKLVNICLNSGYPFIIAPEDGAESDLVMLLEWALKVDDTSHFVAHLCNPDPVSLYFRSYVSHRVRCAMAPLVKATMREPWGNKLLSGGDTAPLASAPDLSVSAITVSKRPWMIKNIIANFERQTYPHKDHIIVLHGDFDDDEKDAVAQTVAEHENTQIIYMQKWLTLGGCINAAISLSKADYVAKFDDDDFYGADYLSDAAAQIWAVDAEIYTQPLSLIYLEHVQKYVYLPESASKGMRYVDADCYSGFFGSGGTLMLKRHLAEQVKFSEDRRGGLDSDWFYRAVNAGHRAYVGGGFNYTFVRRADKGSHTWAVEDDHFLSSGIVLSEGGDLETSINAVNAGQDGMSKA